MANINGLTLKGITRFKGHEGEPLIQGNIYFNNKKVGYYSQDSWGGPDTINIYNKTDEEEINKIAERFFDKYPNGIIPEDQSFTLKDLYRDNYLDGLMGEFIVLIEAEKEYKAAIKKGYKYVLYAKKDKRHYMQVYSVPNDKSLEELRNSNLIIYYEMLSADQFNIEI